MNQREKAEEIIRQGGECRGVSCDFEDENECPIFKLCEASGGNSIKSPIRVSACREFLGEPIIDDAVIGTPRTNAPVKTLLDEFAMAAMEGSDLAIWKINGAGGLADNCYNVASAMMKERARRDEMGNVKEVE